MERFFFFFTSFLLYNVIPLIPSRLSHVILPRCCQPARKLGFIRVCDVFSSRNLDEIMFFHVCRLVPLGGYVRITAEVYWGRIKTGFFLFLNLLLHEWFCESSLFWCVGGKPEVMTPHSCPVWRVNSHHRPYKMHELTFSPTLGQHLHLTCVNTVLQHQCPSTSTN